MSPTSSGNLEVEKYIGACLITQQRSKPSNSYYPRVPDAYPGNYVNYERYRVQRCNSVDRWAGGVPLISFANHQKRNKVEGNLVKNDEQYHQQPSNQLSQLAVHTQGAPLILTKTFNRKKNQKKNFDNKKGLNKSDQNGGGTADTVSVTSDESSGSNNSDNFLPRIIKPRKRRKKDRKPSLGHNLIQDDFSTDSASPDIDTIPVLQNYTPFLFEPHSYEIVPDLPLMKVDDNIEETPQLHHTFEDIEEVDDVDINGNQTVCQCRYCDPAGQIWDVERSCYSPFLTEPRKSFQFPNLQSLISSYEDTCLAHSMSSISLDDKNEDLLRNPMSSARDLEVSTEIVTSLNGHRDIEIKFFSTANIERIPNEKLCDDSAVNNRVCSEVSLYGRSQ